ncbi:MAG TPA: hypothetical protein VNZ04_03080, partial [Trinickia sp.]|nr:hypothetical protein [Trinickia sp.]
MHTVVSGWFGVCAVWFLPLAWRLAKAVLPGGAGLRGPGTIRLWLGFACVLAASCALEAALAPSASNTLGHALLGGASRVLGHAGAPLAALTVLLVSLPWFLGFRWHEMLRAADRAFGLGFGASRAQADGARQMNSPRPQAAARDDDAHPRPAGAGSTRVTTVNSKAPKPVGRYARPTVWQPPAVSRGTLGVKTTSIPAADADAVPPAMRPPQPSKPTMASAGGGARPARPVPVPAR